MDQPKSAVKWEKVHVFISSTFNDMHAERDYLVKRVFPELQEWCEQRKLRLVDIDLRWGVTEQDATHNRNAVKVCLERIDDCRPFFLCFLGQRRGWVPGKDEISEETYSRFPELASHVGKASITELEILHALIKPLHNGIKYDEKKSGEKYEKVEHAFFYLRDGSYLQSIPAEPLLLRETYTNEGIEDPAEQDSHDRELNLWREDLAHKGRPCHVYKAEWVEQASTPEIMLPLAAPSSDPGNIERWRSQWSKAGIAVDGVSIEDDPLLKKRAVEFNQLLSQGRLAGFESDGNELADIILADLKQAITARYPDHLESQEEGELQKELDQQEEFLYINSEGFIQRTGDFDDLDRYLADDSRQLFVLTAPGGMGKSMLLANWIDRAKERSGDAQTLHFRFVGQSDRSTTLSNLLRSLILELQLAGKIPKTTTEAVKDPTGNEATREVPFEIPHYPIKIQNLWNEQMRLIGKQGKTVIVIDAINQLDTGLKELVWLPQYGLPENIKLIVSFRDDATDAQELLKRFSANEQHIRLSKVKPFTDLDDRRKLVNAYLTNYLKEIDDRHLDEIIALKGAENPLFLKVVLSELRVFGSFGSLADKIRNDFGDSPVSTFNGVLQRLENDPAYSAIIPKDAVPLLFGLMAHARNGLAAEELSTMFLQALNLPETEEHQAMALETTRLFLRQVRPFLARRDRRFDFFYESFKTAALEKYVQRTIQEWHQILAGYFVDSAKGSDSSKEWETNCKRGFAECVYHFTKAGQNDLAAELLSNFSFLLNKTRVGLLEGVFEDYDMLRREIPADKAKRLDIWTDFFRGKAHILRRGNDEWPANKILLQLAFEHADDSPLTIAAEKWLAQGHSDWLWLSRVPRLPHYQKDPCLAVLEGHIDKVKGALALPDGRLLSWSDDTTLRLWESQSGASLLVFEGHTDLVNGALALADGRILSWSLDKTSRIWNCKNGICLAVLEGHADEVEGALELADGRLLTWSYRNGNSRLWDGESGECLAVLEGLTGWVTGALQLSDGRLLSWHWDFPCLQLWDGKRDDNLMILRGHEDSVYSALELSDRRLLTWSSDQTLRLWDVQNGACLLVLKGHTGSIRGAAELVDGRLLSWSWDNTLRLWDSHSGASLFVFEGHTDVINGAIEISNRRLLSWSDDKTLKLWDVQSGASCAVLEGNTAEVKGALTLTTGDLISWSNNNTLLMWDGQYGTNLMGFTGHTDKVNGALSMADGQLLSWSDDKTLRLWDSYNIDNLEVNVGHYDKVIGAQALADGRILSWSWDKTLRLWDGQSGTSLMVLKGHTGSIRGAAELVDGRLLSWSWDNTLRLWDSHSGASLFVFEGHTDVVNGALALVDGRILSWSWDNTLRLWDGQSGMSLMALEGHIGPIEGAAELVEGRLLSWSFDNTLRLWNGHSGECLTLVEKDLVVSLHPEWRYAQVKVENPGCVVYNHFADSSANMAYFLFKTTPAILTGWHADTEAETRCLLPDGTVVVTQANGQVCFLKMHLGQRRVSLAEVEEMLPI